MKTDPNVERLLPVFLLAVAEYDTVYIAAESFNLRGCPKHTSGLLLAFVTRFSDAEGLGSLARCLSNSPKLKARFRELERQELDHLAELTQLCSNVT